MYLAFTQPYIDVNGCVLEMAVVNAKDKIAYFIIEIVPALIMLAIPATIAVFQNYCFTN